MVNASTFESGDIVERQLAIDSATGDDDCTRGNSLAVIQFNRVRFAVAGEAFRALGDHDFGAEFLCLGVSTPGQFLSRNSGRKTEIIFNFRTGAGLSAWCLGFNYKHVQAFRCAVNRSGKSCGAGADYNQITQMSSIDRFVESETVGDLPISRITKNRLSAADHDRDVLHGNIKTIEQFLRVRILIEVDIGIRITIARQEFPDPQRFG